MLKSFSRGPRKANESPAVNNELEGCRLDQEPPLDHQKIVEAGKKVGLFRDIFKASLRNEPWAIKLLWEHDIGQERVISSAEDDYCELAPNDEAPK